MLKKKQDASEFKIEALSEKWRNKTLIINTW